MPLLLRHHVSNKPLWGSIKIQEEDQALYPLQKVYADGVEVAISRPVPDRLALMLPLSPGVIDEPFCNEAEHLDWVKLLMEALYNAPTSEKACSKIVKGMCWQAQVKLGNPPSSVSFGLHSPTKILPWRLRVDCCPSKLGAAGLQSLVECLVEASGGQWDLKAARLGSRITQLDVAADIVGADVSSFMVRAPFALKTVQYRSGEGVLETQYGAGTTLLSEKPVFGKVGYRFYDKRKEMIAAGLAPPFGEVPITRIERISRWTAAAPSLDTISQVKNGMADLCVAYLPKASGLPAWEDFASLRLHYSAEQTARKLGYSAALCAQLEEAFNALPFNAFDCPEWWSHWPKAVADSGLGELFVGS